MKEIKIVVRDCHGRRNTYEFTEKDGDVWSKAYSFCLRQNACSDEDEPLLVFIDGACVYSALLSTDGITWEDLIGFFA